MSTTQAQSAAHTQFSNVSIRTDGITTHHAFSIISAFNQGQRDFYDMTEMQGTASNVVF